MKQIYAFLRLLTLYFILGFIFSVNTLSVLSQTKTAYLQLISPNGGESWAAKSTQSIRWESSGVNVVKIEFSFNYGYSWHTITSSVEASKGQYSWTIPNSQTSGVLVKITDVSDTSIYDISDSSFRLFIGTVNKKSQSLNKATNVPDKTAVVTPSDSVKIWPLGDSITDGDGDDPLFNLTSDGYIAVVGWREKLFNLLAGAGYKFRFVGTRISGYDDIPSGDPRTTTDFYIKGRHNDGHGGWVADGIAGRSIAAAVNGWLDTLRNYQGSQNEPEVTICMAGTNDFWDQSVTQVRDHLQNLLSNINTFNSNIRTILTTVIYYHHENRFTITEQNSLNGSYIPNLVNNLISSGNNVSLTDMYSTLSKIDYPTYFSDSTGTGKENFNDVHPNGDGYTRMANTWFAALQDYLPLLQLRVFLQGPYAGSDVMTSSLRNFNKDTTTVDLLPATSPYSDAKTVSYSIPDSITDWIFIEIRDTANNVIKSKSCFLSEHGYVIDPDGFSNNISIGISPGNYYVVVKHRNHLAIMSSNPLELDGVTSYDFTADSAQAYGVNAMVGLGNGKFGMIAGDNDNDGVISINDYNSITYHLSKNGYYIPDNNMDGTVTQSDYSSVSGNLFKYSQVP